MKSSVKILILKAKVFLNLHIFNTVLLTNIVSIKINALINYQFVNGAVARRVRKITDDI